MYSPAVGVAQTRGLTRGPVVCEAVFHTKFAKREEAGGGVQNESLGNMVIEFAYGDADGVVSCGRSIRRSKWLWCRQFTDRHGFLLC